MRYRELIFLFFIGIVLIIVMTVLHKYREIFSPIHFSTEQPNCIFAFDIDGTITCGIDRASKAISKAKELGCKIAINTARPTRWYGDLDLQGLGLNESDFISDFYNGEPFKCSFTDLNCFENSIATTKVNHLHTLSQKWKVKPQRIILFDDQWSNIEKCRQAGFSTIFANHSSCGLPDNVIEQIDLILN